MWKSLVRENQSTQNADLSKNISCGFYPSPLFVCLSSSPLPLFLHNLPCNSTWFAASPLHFPHSHLDFCILHILTLNAFPFAFPTFPPLFPPWFPTFPSLPPWFPVFPFPFPTLPSFQPPFPQHSTHSVPWFPTQAFTDSHFLLLTQYLLLFSENWIY